MKKAMLLVGLALVAGACAQNPEAVQPQYVSSLQYQGLECDQIAQELGRNGTALAQASQQQRNARSNDIAGVILLGLPVSSLSGGNVADYVARLKGEREALLRTSVDQRCGHDAPSAEEIVAASMPPADAPAEDAAGSAARD